MKTVYNIIVTRKTDEKPTETNLIVRMERDTELFRRGGSLYYQDHFSQNIKIGEVNL